MQNPLSTQFKWKMFPRSGSRFSDCKRVATPCPRGALVYRYRRMQGWDARIDNRRGRLTIPLAGSEFESCHNETGTSYSPSCGNGPLKGQIQSTHDSRTKLS